MMNRRNGTRSPKSEWMGTSSTPIARSFLGGGCLAGRSFMWIISSRRAAPQDSGGWSWFSCPRPCDPRGDRVKFSKNQCRR